MADAQRPRAGLADLRDLVAAHLEGLGYTVARQRFAFVPASLNGFPVFGAGLGALARLGELNQLLLESGKVEPLDAIPGPPWDRWIAHTVEFSKTACALGAGLPLPRRTGRLTRRSGQDRRV